MAMVVDAPIRETLPTVDVIAALSDRVAELLDGGLDEPRDVPGARALVEAVEVLHRRTEALRVRTIGAIDASAVVEGDGHRSAQVFHAHVARCSAATAQRLARRRRHLDRVPAFRRAVDAGDTTTDHADRVARALSNPRARDGLVACEDQLVDQARRLHADDFSAFVADLERAADPDGARDRNQRAHERRDFDLQPGLDGTWETRGGWAARQGAELHEIWSKFVEDELDADLEEARSRLGDGFAFDELARTPAQRRADAVLAMARAAAAAGVGADGSRVVTNVVMDLGTFEREVRRLAGEPVTEARPGIDDVICRTLDGHRLEPTETTAAALLGELRRVVIGADGTVIDLGRARRRFTGPARLAVQLANPGGCFWPGCRRPPSRCEVDHLVAWEDGGGTDQTNGGLACGRHNREKYRRGIRAKRLPDGTWTLTHPDGTPIR